MLRFLPYGESLVDNCPAFAFLIVCTEDWFDLAILEA